MRLDPESLVIVTGGAGYLGSHLCEALLGAGHRVRAVDNLSAGRRENLVTCLPQAAFDFVQADLLTEPVAELLRDGDAVFHLAANPDVRTALTDPRVDVEQNVQVTHRVLEGMRRTEVTALLFPSTSTVYGEAAVVPTPEDYGPMEPISVYGATKLAAEALIAAYCHTFGLEAVTFRFANVVGGRSTHGVVPDLVRRLRRDPRTLKILGAAPGTTKSYCYIDDCITGLLAGWTAAEGSHSVYNLGSPDQITVQEVADAVCAALGITGTTYAWTGGAGDGRGWPGDVRSMWLDARRLEATGWKPRYTSREAVHQATLDLTATE